MKRPGSTQPGVNSIWTAKNTKQKGSGKAYKDGSKITVKEDTTLYAQ